MARHRVLHRRFRGGLHACGKRLDQWMDTLVLPFVGGEPCG
jgi:hypothetical protein